MYTRNVGTLGLAALLCLLSATAFAGQPDGVWKGSVQRGKASPVPMDIRFDGKGGNVHFGSPYRCAVPLESGGDDAGSTYIFGTSGNGGGFCDGLADAKLQVKQGSDAKVLVVTFESVGLTGRGSWSGTLRQDKPSP
ncbi:hypothetical protein ACQKIE_04775 [Luteibacter sp. NPDC031894]|uniref:hypothetical protein n=1 Tax=Luteibacter sp. NPDC031894 TaxID=3390572 RepID=UPI003D080C36